jgi:hypothetical protein
MGKVLEEYFEFVIGSDIEPQTDRGIEGDFLTDAPMYAHAIITNPPYGSLTTAFIERGLNLSAERQCQRGRNAGTQRVGLRLDPQAPVWRLPTILREAGPDVAPALDRQFHRSTTS